MAAVVIPGLAGRIPTADAAAKSTRYCKPSKFHWTTTSYSKWKVKKVRKVRFGKRSGSIYNSARTFYRPTISLSASAATGMTFSSSVAVEASGIVASVKAETGFAVSSSATVSTSYELPLAIPPKHYGWVQAEVHKITLAGRFKQVDMICNKVLKRGRIRVTLPKGAPSLRPKYSRYQPG